MGNSGFHHRRYYVTILQLLWKGTVMACCDIFKKECDKFKKFDLGQDGIGKSSYSGKYYFYFEGWHASFPLIYCPNCGKKLENIKL